MSAPKPSTPHETGRASRAMDTIPCHAVASHGGCPLGIDPGPTAPPPECYLLAFDTAEAAMDFARGVYEMARTQHDRP